MTHSYVEPVDRGAQQIKQNDKFEDLPKRARHATPNSVFRAPVAMPRSKTINRFISLQTVGSGIK